MMVEISAKFFWGIIGASMWLFETGFRIFISATVFSESAVDLVHLISQTEVSTWELIFDLLISEIVFNVLLIL